MTVPGVDGDVIGARLKEDIPVYRKGLRSNVLGVLENSCSAAHDYRCTGHAEQVRDLNRKANARGFDVHRKR